MTAEKIVTDLEARRRALKMPYGALAVRSNLTPRTVRNALIGKCGKCGKKGANLSTVAAIARALGAGVGLVGGSALPAVRRQQARKKAKRLVAIAQGSAALEAQAVDDRAVRKAERQVEATLLAGPPVRLWAQ